MHLQLVHLELAAVGGAQDAAWQRSNALRLARDNTCFNGQVEFTKARKIIKNYGDLSAQALGTHVEVLPDGRVCSLCHPLLIILPCMHTEPLAEPSTVGPTRALP